MVTEVNEEVLMYVRQLAERESKMQKELEVQYMLGIGDGYNDGFNDGYRDGLQEGFEKGRCETWDEAYSEGYKAWKDEQAVQYDTSHLAFTKVSRIITELQTQGYN